MQVAPLRALIALLLAVLALSSTGCSPEAQRGGAKVGRENPAAAARVSTSALQEVAPPGGVAQATPALTAHTPMVEIIAPLNDALLPDGEWTLQLRVRDWPLAESRAGVDPSAGAGPLDLGPHLVVQLDQDEPLRLAEGKAGPAGNRSDSLDVTVTMPALQPGSHRLTVYAARPWGEAVKSAGAVRQIHLHRVARNPAQLPAPGSAQLIVASPDALQQQEPVLIDWLLLDAPLQHLRDDDARWRLRVSVNGDSVLVDRQTPLWLKGFRRGSNAVQLELLDDHGEPLNAPYNSVVREVLIGAGAPPTWRRPSLSAEALAQLSGERPPLPATPLPGNRPTAVEEQTPLAVPAEQATAEQKPAAPALTPPTQPGSEGSDSTEVSGPEAATPESGAPEAPGLAARPVDTGVDAGSAGVASGTDGPATGSAPREGDAGTAQPRPAEAGASEEPSDTAAAGPQTETRVSASSSLAGSARDQVNADGSLLQPQRRGPLAGLREKLGE